MRIKRDQRDNRSLTSALEQYRNSYPEYEDEPAYHILIVLNDRLELLNKFFTAAISGNNELDRLVADRDMFLYTTRMTFL